MLFPDIFIDYIYRRHSSRPIRKNFSSYGPDFAIQKHIEKTQIKLPNNPVESIFEHDLYVP